MLALCSLNISIQCPDVVGDLQMDAEPKVSASSMKSFLKDIDDNGGLEKKMKDTKALTLYLKYCNSLFKPRKMMKAIKVIIKNETGNLVLTQYIEDYGNLIPVDIINRIAELSDVKGKLQSEINGLLLSDDISGQFRNYKPSKGQISRMCEFLNNPDLISEIKSRKLMKELFLRLQKMYRGGRWEVIIKLFGHKIKVGDDNFQCYKFFILSLKRKNMDDLVEKNLSKIYKNIGEMNNLEDLVDMLYTNNMHKEVIETCNSLAEIISFRTTLIYSRSLRKTGLNFESEIILEEAKERLHSMIISEDADIPSITKSIMDIGYSGDIKVSERLLYELTSRKEISSEIVSGGLINIFVDLVKDTLDRQKRIRLGDALEISRNLLTNGNPEVAFRLLDPYVEHGIGNSADLYDLFASAGVKSGNIESVNDLLIDNAKKLNLTTIERLLVTLDKLGQFKLHSDLIKNTNTTNLDSVKVIRSYFKVRTQYSGGLEPTEYLKKITSLRGGCKQLSVFIDSFCKQELPPKKVIALIISSKSSNVEKLSCILKIHETKNSSKGIFETTRKVEKLSGDELKDPRAQLLIDRSVTLSYNKGDFDIAISLVEKYEQEYTISRQMAAAKIRSLISKGMVNEAREFFEIKNTMFTEIQQLRFLLQLGEKSLVKERIGKMNINSMPVEKSKNIASILFSLNMFEDYCDIYRNSISAGDFNLVELTRYFHSLCKLGEDTRMEEEFSDLRLNYSLNSRARLIMAIVGYDFSLCDDYIEEIEISLSMDTKKTDLPILVCNSFISLERIDLAYYFFSSTIRFLQHSSEALEIGKKIEEAFKLLEINPKDIDKNQIKYSPRFTDVEVIRMITERFSTVNTDMKKRSIRKRGAKIAINSHTLDIGGAERQVSLLLKMLSSQKIKSQSFSLITNSVPNTESRDTYYPVIEGLDIEIFEYSKPRGYYGDFEIDREIEDLIMLMAPLKAKRILAMIPLFQRGQFDIIHTWQDWCNIYGGIAAMISGCNNIILSGRTLPPILKGRLQSRSGRSYADSYRHLLSSNRFTMTHNSDSGRIAYSDWLNIPKDDFSVIHNGLETSNFSVINKERVRKLREEIGISKEAKIIGTVGRLTSDKRPWIFLGIAERILSDSIDFSYSPGLEKWINENNSGNKPELEENRLIQSNQKIEDINFIMVGDGPQLEKARQIVEESEVLKGKVHLVGYSSEVNLFLEMFDCFILTSKVEGLPNVIIEAQFCGVPVLTTDAGGAKECIIEGETGFLSNSDSIEELSLNLKNMLSDRKFLKNAKKKSKKFAKESFGEDTWANKINQLYAGGK